MVQSLYHLIRVKGDIITVRCQYSILQLVEGVHQRLKNDSDRPGLENRETRNYTTFSEKAQPSEGVKLHSNFGREQN